jgi:hypothetical protein
VVTKERRIWQCRVTKGTIKQKPESAALAEPGLGTIFRLAIGTTMMIHNWK